MPRNKLTAEGVAYAMDKIKEALGRRLTEKGPMSLTSTHEILGIIAEEYDELVEATRMNEFEHFEEELIDIAVGCIVGIMSKYDKGLDW